MIAVVQRVSHARVTVHGSTVGEIDRGLLVLAAIHADDTPADLQWTAAKLTTLRLFPNADKPLDLDVQTIHGGILLVSNFTVAADTRKGRRPSLDLAAPPAVAKTLFDDFVAAVRKEAPHTPVATGQFGADMQVTLTNDGPVTILLDSRQSR